jgi:hypothetical protein
MAATTLYIKNTYLSRLSVQYRYIFFHRISVPVEVKLNATLVNETYTEELKDVSSPKFKKLASRFKTEVR